MSQEHEEEAQEAGVPLQLADMQALTFHFLNEPFIETEEGENYTKGEFLTLLIQNLNLTKNDTHVPERLQSEINQANAGLLSLLHALKNVSEGEDLAKNLQLVGNTPIFLQAALTAIFKLSKLHDDELQAQIAPLTQGIHLFARDIEQVYGGFLQHAHLSEHSVARPKTTVKAETADVEPGPSLGLAAVQFLQIKINWKGQPISPAEFIEKLCNDLDQQQTIIDRILETSPEKKDSLPTSEEISSAKQSFQSLITSMETIADGYGKENYDKSFKPADIENVKKWFVPFAEYNSISEKVVDAAGFNEAVRHTDFDTTLNRENTVAAFVTSMTPILTPITSALGSPASRA